MQRVVIATQHLGLQVSRKALVWLIERGYADGQSWLEIGDEHNAEFPDLEEDIYTCLLERGDALLLQCLDELGTEAQAEGHAIKVVEIPDGVEWDIGWCEYGGEWVYEKHRTWN